ncbi:peptide chain release factor N(5)-glutamine methyltransferase [Tessaracoccus defluvii]|uniref:peptide chain release factor N(5)-glutamine methyltransferase n=1 Tax=Tessaracoccus defluvii TaxID=1285901 RepID=A0A7H0H803_9ACTN|nr:peptide chain release factor N(5)-glutamine methyltransferase [Tessaracoccus defluvii]QNP56669.1 peptide chain release factor N(5)-glutamine methyltransferase [Tessaracoccus defluvii]
MSELAYEAAGRLARSGSASPGPDARLLVAHVLGLRPGELMLVDEVSDEARAAVDALVERRAAGEPLQHLTGEAYFRRETLAVGPGVFIPRPETEVMVGWALDRLAARPDGERRVVELCAGSGAITAALTGELGGLDAHAVEISPEAFGYLERNLAGRGVGLVLGDMGDAFGELDGTVDLVIANPPYVPAGHRNLLPSDVVDHDPGIALFSGADGLDALRVVAAVAARLLRPGGLVTAEHDESHAPAVRALFAEAGFLDVVTHDDLARRPRFVTARLP